MPVNGRRALVAWAGRMGSTHEIAQAIGAELAQAGYQVVLRRVSTPLTRETTTRS